MAEVHLSGHADIDGALWGYKWDITHLTYAIPTNTNGYGYDVDGFEAFNTAQKAAVTRAFGEVASFTGLSFTQTTSTNATIRFGEAESFEVESGPLAGTVDNAIGWGTRPIRRPSRTICSAISGTTTRPTPSPTSVRSRFVASCTRSDIRLA